MNQSSEILEDLRSRFHPRIAIDLVEVAPLLGTGASTLKNLLTRGELPFSTQKIGRRRVVPLATLASYLACGEQANDRKRRGPARKIAGAAA